MEDAGRPIDDIMPWDTRDAASTNSGAPSDLAEGRGARFYRAREEKTLMATIKVPLGPPCGTVPVNTNAICAAIPDPALPDAATELLIDSAGGRSINALVAIGEIGRILGGDFAEFTAADPPNSTCFVNRTAWVSVVPHPQVKGVGVR